MRYTCCCMPIRMGANRLRAVYCGEKIQIRITVLPPPIYAVQTLTAISPSNGAAVMAPAHTPAASSIEDLRQPQSRRHKQSRAYLNTIFPDQRGVLLTDPVSLNAQGLMLDLHSYGRLVLWPWSFTEVDAPNHTQLQTLGRKFSFFNGYTPSQAVDLYVTDGSSDDFAYGELGLAAYTIELGNEFFETCAAFENDILPDNLPALLYAAKVAGLPYLTPAGPEVLNLTSVKSGLRLGEPFSITAAVDDTRYKSDTEPTQKIIGAEYYLDIPPNTALSPTQSHRIEASDGNYDQKIETIAASIPTLGLASGRHALFVRGMDETGVWGPLSSIYFYLYDPNTAPTLQGFVRTAGSEKPLAAAVQAGSFRSSSQPDTGAYSMKVLPGVYEMQVSAPGHSTLVTAGISLSTQQIMDQDFSLVPECALISDNVESGANGWSAQPAWAISSETSHSPTHAWSDSPASLYKNLQDISLTSPILDLSGLSDPYLSFWHKYDTEDGYDYARIEYSINGGGTWLPVQIFTGKQTEWMQAIFQLPQLQSQSAARIRFRLTTDIDITRDGWHVDDIQLSAKGVDCQVAQPPISDFSAPSPVLVGQQVRIHNLSYAYPTPSYLWNFGDGAGASTERDPVYTFQSPGEYLVQLVVTNELGTGTTSQLVTVTRYAFSLASNLIYQQGQPGETLTYVLELENQGLEADMYQVNVLSPWITQILSAQGEILTGSQVSLASGEKMILQVRVQIPASANPGQENISQINLMSLGVPGYSQTLSLLTQAGWYQTRLPLVVR